MPGESLYCARQKCFSFLFHRKILIHERNRISRRRENILFPRKLPLFAVNLISLNLHLFVKCLCSEKIIIWWERYFSLCFCLYICIYMSSIYFQYWNIYESKETVISSSEDWDFDIRMDHLISDRRPDLIIIKKKKKRICKIVDFAVPADHRIKLKECENKDKYLDLARAWMIWKLADEWRSSKRQHYWERPEYWE